jgi:hypothetical protein
VKTDIILFLNKEDLFRTKISQVDLNVCFSEYTGLLVWGGGGVQQTI